MNTSCPSCGTLYSITPQHVGREVSCRKCGSLLVVTSDALQLASASAPSPDDEAEDVDLPMRGRAAPPRPRAAPGLTDAMGRVADGPTWCFGAGAFLVILFLFFPLIDQAKVNRRQAAIREGDLRELRRERDFNEKKKKGEKVDEDARKKSREAWEKEKTTLQDDAEEAQIALLRAPYWYRWGMMFGFLLLAAASLGYLSPGQPTIRRVTGCIVIVAEVLLIFIAFVGRSGLGP